MPNNCWCEVSVDGQLDAFGALFPVRETADRGGFANTFNAIACAQTDNNQGLLLHGRHCQLMRANGREVYENRFDVGDLGVHTWSGGVDELAKYCATRNRLSNTIDV